MKKTVNVNIGGAPFIVDEDAYGMLKKYLNEIEIRLDGVDDKETMQDIEIRIADIFNGAISAQSQVVDAALVKRAIAIIGSAREFGEPRPQSPGPRTRTGTRSAAPALPEPPREDHRRRMRRYRRVLGNRSYVGPGPYGAVHHFRSRPDGLHRHVDHHPAGTGKTREL